MRYLTMKNKLIDIVAVVLVSTTVTISRQPHGISNE